MRISDWSSDVCSSDLCRGVSITAAGKASRSTSQWSGSAGGRTNASASSSGVLRLIEEGLHDLMIVDRALLLEMMRRGVEYVQLPALHHPGQHHRIRSEEHTSELQSLMRCSYAVFCLKKKNSTHQYTLCMPDQTTHTQISPSYTKPHFTQQH